MTLNEAQQAIGKKVIYTPFLGCDANMTETGVITLVTKKYVFVKYGSDLYAKATNVKDIEFDNE
jgi:hypothetical protein